MAKMKTYAVTVQHTVTETIYVEARRPNGAAERALSPEVYLRRYGTDCGAEDCTCGPTSVPRDAVVTDIRVTS